MKISSVTSSKITSKTGILHNLLYLTTETEIVHYCSSSRTKVRKQTRDKDGRWAMYVRFLRLLRPPEKNLVNLTKGPYTAFKSPATLIRKCQNIHSYSRLKCKCRMSRHYIDWFDVQNVILREGYYNFLVRHKSAKMRILNQNVTEKIIQRITSFSTQFYLKR